MGRLGMVITKLTSIWVLACLLGIMLREFLPHARGFGITHRGLGYLVPYNKLAFWGCLLAGTLILFASILRLVGKDLGMR